MAAHMSHKVALVTGGSLGIGKATASAFADAGASVIVTSRTEEKGHAVVEKIRAKGGNAVFVQADITDPASVKAMVEVGLKAFGRIDCAFNNAGPGITGSDLAEASESYFDYVMDGYLKSVFLCMKHQLAAMLEQGGGVIVNNASVDGLRGFAYDPIYAAAKHGVVGLTRSAALQYATRNIRINAVCPSWILTPAIEKKLPGNPDIERQMRSHQPIQRFGKPEEVAAAVVFLCSDAASLIHGTALEVDGGYLAM